MDFLSDLGFESVISIVLSGIGLFAAISRVTPNKTDDKILGFLLKVINVFGLKDKNGNSGVGQKQK